MSARKSDTASKSTPVPPEDYESLIERLRETVNAVIPRNASVLVVSRGDDELLRIGPRRGLHFPQDEFGGYPGYHPEDSEAAIAMLEDMRARGGEYLLLPETAFWWLDYYEGLRDHLEGNYPSIVSGDDCMIFELAGVGVQPPAPDADSTEVSAATSSRRLAEPLDELLQALLPADATIAVVGSDADLPSFGQCSAVQPPSDGADLGALLAESAAAGAKFVVIPAAASDRVHGDGEPVAPVGAWKLVTRQHHLCEIYEHDPAERVPSPPKAEPSSANGGFLGRFAGLLRRG